LAEEPEAETEGGRGARRRPRLRRRWAAEPEAPEAARRLREAVAAGA